VIIGDPGAGKTVLATLLTLRLLDEWTPEQPVPVILQVSSWDLRRDDFHTWLARRMMDDYPFLSSTSVLGPEHVSLLIKDAKVLPILDGLDELPAALRTISLDAIDRQHGDRPIVITCRTAEYEDNVRTAGRIFPGALVFEIEAIRAHDAVEFLAARFPPGPPRWQQLFSHLLTNEDSACRRALSTPADGVSDEVRVQYCRHPPCGNPGPGPLSNTRDDRAVSTGRVYRGSIYAGRYSTATVRSSLL
jgi:hypothetical protein